MTPPSLRGKGEDRRQAWQKDPLRRKLERAFFDLIKAPTDDEAKAKFQEAWELYEMRALLHPLAGATR